MMNTNLTQRNDFADAKRERTEKSAAVKGTAALFFRKGEWKRPPGARKARRQTNKKEEEL